MLVYKCGQEKLNNLYYQVKEKRRCSAWRKTKLIEDFTVHALRDAFAIRYIEQGGSPQTLKTILGHSSLAMTMDLYSHFNKGMDNVGQSL